MKKIAFITDGWERYVTYAWIQGYRRYMAEHPLTADLYVFHSFGNFSKDQNFNTGEYNIIQLPDLSAFDGIILDLANILNVSIKEKITELAAKASVPVVSLMEKIPGMYFSCIDNQNAVRTLVEHLITKHHCRTINYIHGPESSYEDQQRFLAYRDKDLLPDAFVCANDNIAVGVCLAAEESGYKIPNDFLITGFDNENKASFFNPRITTVGFSKAEVMYNALRLFHDIWNDKNVSDHIYAPVTHVFQESCRCTPANPADRGQYVANSIMSEVHQNDMQNWIFPQGNYFRKSPSPTSQMYISLPRFISANVRLAIWFSKTAIIFLRISFFLRH